MDWKLILLEGRGDTSLPSVVTQAVWYAIARVQCPSFAVTSCVWAVRDRQRSTEKWLELVKEAIATTRYANVSVLVVECGRWSAHGQNHWLDQLRRMAR